jgi:pyruvate carboxylase subunit B
MSPSTFEAIINDRTIELSIDGENILLDDRRQPYSLEQTGPYTYSLLLGNRSASVLVEPLGEKKYRIIIGGRSRIVQLRDEQDLLLEELGLDEMLDTGEEEIRAPMPGLILDVRVTPGQRVEPNDGLVVVEAMKMENELQAPVGGRVTAVEVTTGDTVDKSQLLITIERSSS